MSITVPGSKSITNRALILAALSSGTVTLTGALWSEDTQVMTECLRQLGFAVGVAQDLAEEANRVIQVEGLGADSQGRHGVLTLGIVCGQCWDGGPFSGGHGVFGRGVLPVVRGATNA